MTKYVVDSMAYLRYLVDKLPDETNTIFDRAEAGLDVLYAPDVVIGETLYEVAFGGHIAGVQLQGNPNGVYRLSRASASGLDPEGEARHDGSQNPLLWLSILQ